MAKQITLQFFQIYTVIISHFKIVCGTHWKRGSVVLFS